MEVNSTTMVIENDTNPGNRTQENASIKVSYFTSNPLLHETFNLYLTSIFMPFGIVANILICIVMRHRSFKQLPLAVYFSSLAVSDTIVLTITCVMQIIKQTIDVNILSLHVSCTVFGTLLPGAAMTSSWFIVCIACERFLVVKFPLKAKQLTSKKKAKMAVTAISLCSIFLNMPNIWMVDFHSKSTCNYLPIFHWFHSTWKGLVFLIGYNLIPLLITCVCYILVIVMVRKKRMVATNSANNKDKLTVTALAICLCFMILTTPIAVRILLSRLKYFKPEQRAMYLVYDTVAQFLRQLNYGTNFFIYLASNVQFRKSFREMMCRRSTQVGDTGISLSVIKPATMTSVK